MKTGNPVYRNIHQELIDSCRKRDIKAQFKIYRLYYKNMFNISLRIVNDSLEAEDIMQECFLTAFEKIDGYSGEVSFGAWLKKIVINRSLDALRKKKIEFTGIDEGSHLPDDEGADTDEEYTGQKVEEIHRCIRMLPDGYRVILSLYLLEGYDHEEIGEILDISASTSRSQYTRARRKLCTMLKSSN